MLAFKIYPNIPGVMTFCKICKTGNSTPIEGTVKKPGRGVQETLKFDSHREFLSLRQTPQSQDGHNRCSKQLIHEECLGLHRLKRMQRENTLTEQCCVRTVVALNTI